MTLTARAGKHSKKFPPEERLRAVRRAQELPKRTEAAFKNCAAEFGASGRQLYRWLRRFEDTGTKGLTDSRRRDAGRPRLFRFPSAVVFVLLRHADGLGVAAIHKSLKRAWPLLYPGFRCPSRGMVRSLV